MFSGLTQEYVKSVDGKKVYYYRNSNFDTNKDTIVFNYGLACSLQHFEYQVAFFQQNYNIIASDYRGHYKSECDENLGDLTFANFAFDLCKIFEKENIQTAVLVGHSMGVNVSLEFARKFPQKTKALVLISGTAQPVFSTMFNSNISEHVTPYLKKLFFNFPHVVKGLWKNAKFSPVIRKIVHIGGFNTKYVSDEFISIYLTKIDELGPSIFLKMIEKMNEHDIMGCLVAIKVHTLIIGGDSDKVIPNYNQKLLQEQIPNSELFIVRNGSHVPQVDFPHFINERLNLFLDDLKEA